MKLEWILENQNYDTAGIERWFLALPAHNNFLQGYIYFTREGTFNYGRLSLVKDPTGTKALNTSRVISTEENLWKNSVEETKKAIEGRARMYLSNIGKLSMK